jgi:hypothetical protein
LLRQKAQALLALQLEQAGYDPEVALKAWLQEWVAQLDLPLKPQQQASLSEHLLALELKKERWATYAHPELLDFVPQLKQQGLPRDCGFGHVLQP